MKKSTKIGILAVGGAALIAGGVVFYRWLDKKITELEEEQTRELEAKNKELYELEESIKEKDSEVEAYKEELENTNYVVGEKGESILNPELVEMRKRYNKPVVHENAWDNNPVFPAGREDVPLEEVEAAYKEIEDEKESVDVDPKEEVRKVLIALQGESDYFEIVEQLRSVGYAGSVPNEGEETDWEVMVLDTVHALYDTVIEDPENLSLEGTSLYDTYQEQSKLTYGDLLVYHSEEIAEGAGRDIAYAVMITILYDFNYFLDGFEDLTQDSFLDTIESAYDLWI